MKNTKLQSRQKHKGKETMETRSTQKTNEKMSAVHLHRSITTLNVNGLALPIKRQTSAGKLEKHDPTICCLQEPQLHWC